MSDPEIIRRLEDLEIRYSHQETALEELTRTVLSQEQLLKSQRETIARLELALKMMDAGTAGVTPENEKPPHY